MEDGHDRAPRHPGSGDVNGRGPRTPGGRAARRRAEEQRDGGAHPVPTARRSACRTCSSRSSPGRSAPSERTAARAAERTAHARPGAARTGAAGPGRAGPGAAGEPRHRPVPARAAARRTPGPHSRRPHSRRPHSRRPRSRPSHRRPRHRHGPYRPSRGHLAPAAPPGPAPAPSAVARSVADRSVADRSSPGPVGGPGSRTRPPVPPARPPAGRPPVAPGRPGPPPGGPPSGQQGRAPLPAPPQGPGRTGRTEYVPPPTPTRPGPVAPADSARTPGTPATGAPTTGASTTGTPRSGTRRPDDARESPETPADAERREARPTGAARANDAEEVRRIDETLTRLTAAHAGVTLARTDADAPAPLPERVRVRPGIAQVLVAVLALAVFAVTAFQYVGKARLDAAVTQVTALDPDSGAIVDADAQAGDENVLIVGTEPAGTAGGAPTDTVLLAHVPAGGGDVVGVSVPHDLEVNRPPCGRWDADRPRLPRRRPCPREARTPLDVGVTRSAGRSASRASSSSSPAWPSPASSASTSTAGRPRRRRRRGRGVRERPVVDGALGPVVPAAGTTVARRRARRATSSPPRRRRRPGRPARGVLERQQRRRRRGAGERAVDATGPARPRAHRVAAGPSLGHRADRRRRRPRPDPRHRALAEVARRPRVSRFAAAPTSARPAAGGNTRGPRHAEAAALFAALRERQAAARPRPCPAAGAGPRPPTSRRRRAQRLRPARGSPTRSAARCETLGFVVGEIGNAPQPAPDTVDPLLPRPRGARPSSSPGHGALGHGPCPTPASTGVLQLVLGRSFDGVAAPAPSGRTGPPPRTAAGRHHRRPAHDAPSRQRSPGFIPRLPGRPPAPLLSSPCATPTRNSSTGWPRSWLGDVRPGRRRARQGHQGAAGGRPAARRGGHLRRHRASTRLRAAAEEQAFALLALQAPVATDLRIVVVRHPRRRRHRADGRPRAARRPGRAPPPPAARAARTRSAPYFAEMGRIGRRSGPQGRRRHPHPRSRAAAGELESDDDAMDDLHRHLFTVLMDRNWTHGVGPAVDITLLGPVLRALRRPRGRRRPPHRLRRDRPDARPAHRLTPVATVPLSQRRAETHRAARAACARRRGHRPAHRHRRAARQPGPPRRARAQRRRARSDGDARRGRAPSLTAMALSTRPSPATCAPSSPRSAARATSSGWSDLACTSPQAVQRRHPDSVLPAEARDDLRRRWAELAVDDGRRSAAEVCARATSSWRSSSTTTTTPSTCCTGGRVRGAAGAGVDRTASRRPSTSPCSPATTSASPTTPWRVARAVVYAVTGTASRTADPRSDVSGLRRAPAGARDGSAEAAGDVVLGLLAATAGRRSSSSRPSRRACRAFRCPRC